MVEQMEDMSQPENSDIAKMLKYTEARFAQYRKDTNRKLVLHKKRIFELEDGPWKLKGEPSSKEDDYRRCEAYSSCQASLHWNYFSHGRSIPVKMSQLRSPKFKGRMEKF
uniref:Uncharacterized protein n=1 Tax=Oryza nivara TaxID=4536 RepID=A0A0E0IUS8_ORYNI